jgi:hypothetical protein
MTMLPHVGERTGADEILVLKSLSPWFRTGMVVATVELGNTKALGVDNRGRLLSWPCRQRLSSPRCRPGDSVPPAPRARTRSAGRLRHDRQPDRDVILWGHGEQ